MNPAQEDILIGGRSEGVGRVGAHDVGESPRLPGRQVTQGKIDQRRDESFLSWGVDVRASPFLETRRRRIQSIGDGRWKRLRHRSAGRRELGPLRIRLEHRALRFDQTLELVQPQLSDEKLDARLVPVALLAVSRVDARDRLRDRQHLRRRQEIVQLLRDVRHGSEPAADDHAKAAHLASIDRTHGRDEAEVVHHRPAAAERVGGASGIRDLELSPEVLHVAMPEQEPHLGVRVRRDVERFVMADAGIWTSGDVAHGVAARLARRDPDARQPPVHVRRVLDVDEMQLNVLPRRDVQNAVRVFFGAVGEDLELFRRELAERKLDALHPRRVELGVRPLRETAARKRNLLRAHAVVSLAVVVALAIGAATKPKLREDLFFELAGLAKLHLILEQIDLVRHGGRNLVGEYVTPRCALVAHGWVSANNAVVRYRAPESGAIAATRCPRPSSRAISSAAQTIAPLDMPTNNPSSRASRRASGKASSSHACTTRSITVRSRFAGMNPGPMPWNWCCPRSPPERTGDRAGSTATTSVSANCSLRKRPTPLIVPPVPDPYTKASIRPFIWAHSSGPVVS